MQRREFLEGCAAASLGAWAQAWAQSPARTYPRSRLVDIHGRPIRLTALEPEVNYVFQYPFEATPCLLVKLRAPVAVQPALKRADGTAYTWNGGVGRDRNAVAFSAICAHKRIVSSLEGGYALSALGRSAAEHVRVLVEG